MFVRWKSRPNHRCWAEPGERQLVAELAECRRVDGRPRQRILAYLGTVAESDISLPRPLSLAAFWSRVDRVLGEIIFDDELRDELAMAIERRVPRPTVGAVAQT